MNYSLVHLIEKLITLSEQLKAEGRSSTALNDAIILLKRSDGK